MELDQKGCKDGHVVSTLHNPTIKTPDSYHFSPNGGKEDQQQTDYVEQSALSLREDVLSSNEAQHGSETGAEDASASEEDQRQLAHSKLVYLGFLGAGRLAWSQGRARVKQVSSAPDRQGGTPTSSPAPIPDITQAKMVRREDLKDQMWYQRGSLSGLEMWFKAASGEAQTF
eukprot:1150027-Pelagomonas_calceolata.AAC.4